MKIGRIKQLSPVKQTLDTHQEHLKLHGTWIKETQDEARQEAIELRKRVKDLEERVAWLIENVHTNMTTGRWPEP